MPLTNRQLESKLWDVVIIGAGMGGGFAAYALAEAGHDVLLIDYGNEYISPICNKQHEDDPQIRIAESKWPTVSAFEVDGVTTRCYPPLGVGVGGSANWYAAALERFDHRDIDPLTKWPIRYQDLVPHYEMAERLLHVCGTADPLGPCAFHHLAEPPPLGPRDEDFLHFFQNNGLHPYRLHVGIRYRPGCDECLGRLCHKECRADVRSVLAESSRKPTIMARSEVTRLEATLDRVTRAIVLQGDQQVTVEAKLFVLAAGATHTPKLLLRSCNDIWPDGLANRSGLVGRNLMFHAHQTFALWPSRRLASTGPRKSLAFKDFFEVGGERLGAVQSTGFELGYGEYLTHLYQRFDRSALRRLRLLRPFLRIPALLTIKALGRATIFACLIEDMPYLDNRVVLDDTEADGIRLKYFITEELRRRFIHFKQLLVKQLKGRRMVPLTPDVDLNYGHPCGTCVMGDDASTSVIDRNCRAHGLDNLFIVDASFMPTSAATNPSLTIAANALRVSREMSRLLRTTAIGD